MTSLVDPASKIVHLSSYMGTFEQSLAKSCRQAVRFRSESVDGDPAGSIPVLFGRTCEEQSARACANRDSRTAALSIPAYPGHEAVLGRVLLSEMSDSDVRFHHICSQ
eukprot:2146354-Amphidinium_carterae.1